MNCENKAAGSQKNGYLSCLALIVVGVCVLVILHLGGYLFWSTFIKPKPLSNKELELIRFNKRNSFGAFNRLRCSVKIMRMNEKEHYWEKDSSAYKKDSCFSWQGYNYCYHYFSNDIDGDDVDEATAFVYLAVPKAYKHGKRLYAITHASEEGYFTCELSEREFAKLQDLETTVKWIGKGSQDTQNLSEWEVLKDLGWIFIEKEDWEPL